MSDTSGKGGLLRSSAVVSVMTLLSRVLGMVRDMVVASYFGSGAAADAFFIAFKIPNFLRRLFAEGAFAQAFVPVLSEYRTKRTLQDVKQLVDRTAGMLGLDRKSVVWGKSVSVRVDLGGSRLIKKKKDNEKTKKWK